MTRGRGLPRRAISIAGKCGVKGPGRLVVFADDMTAWEMRELLADISGTIVKEPSPLGAYLGEISPAVGSQDGMGQILNAVRAHRKVRLAEPVVAR